jgi:predicted NUDIX family phosphoesterase
MGARTLNDSYLKLALSVLRAVRQPLTAGEIIALANAHGSMPSRLHGKTQHKTLNARLSEHIQGFREKSLVYRVAPAKYFLTEFLNDPTIPAAYKKRYRGFLRYKQIRSENVLVSDANQLRSEGIVGFVPFSPNWFSHNLKNRFYFVDRRIAEGRDDIKQFVSYTILYRNKYVLSYRRGRFNTAALQFKGLRSIGFGGHVSNADFDLFTRDDAGLFNNVARELREELDIRAINTDIPTTLNRLRILGLLNVDDSAEARKHVAVVMLYCPPDDFRLEKNEMSITQLSWLDLRSRLNDLSGFELWSEILLTHIYSGGLHLELLSVAGGDNNAILALHES